jgi:hypothetical protein
MVSGRTSLPKVFDQKGIALSADVTIVLDGDTWVIETRNARSER